MFFVQVKEKSGDAIVLSLVSWSYPHIEKIKALSLTYGTRLESCGTTQVAGKADRSFLTPICKPFG